MLFSPASLDAILEFTCDLIEPTQSLIIIAQGTDFIAASTRQLILELQHIKARGKSQAKFFLLSFHLGTGQDRGSSPHFHTFTERLKITHGLVNLTRHRLLHFTLVDEGLFEQQILLL